MPRPETPLLTVDIIIELPPPRAGIVLIERKNPPHGWALPGGFVDPGETVETAAAREALEETGLEIRLRALLGCYSDPRRDPRGHTASVVYVASARGEPRARSDACRACVADPQAITVPLAFDHGRILEDYRFFLALGRAPQWAMDASPAGGDIPHA